MVKCRPKILDCDLDFLGGPLSFGRGLALSVKTSRPHRTVSQSSRGLVLQAAAVH